ncbi:MAG: hypothetical protein H0T50_05535 [Gemmatimonadales bacterium]|nr:hypothetical protein [Gemmatimonadales bacterium]
MLRVLRRCRTLALALLLAAPGLGGTWLAAAHPCPVDSPILAHRQQAHGGHTPGSDSTQPGHDQCVCLGSCQPPSFTAPVKAPAAAIEVPLFNLASSRPDAEALAPRERPFRLHPPSTAPPPLS